LFPIESIAESVISQVEGCMGGVIHYADAKKSIDKIFACHAALAKKVLQIKAHKALPSNNNNSMVKSDKMESGPELAASTKKEESEVDQIASSSNRIQKN